MAQRYSDSALRRKQRVDMAPVSCRSGIRCVASARVALLACDYCVRPNEVSDALCAEAADPTSPSSAPRIVWSIWGRRCKTALASSTCSRV